MSGESPLDASHARLSLTVEDLKKQVLVPIEATITEAISEPFRAVVQLVSTDRTLDLRASLGKEALLTLHHAAGTRHVHGIVSHVRIAGPTRENHRYELTIVPRIWLLSCRQNCRIFQGASVVDIVQEVCESVGMSDIDPRVSGHTPRDFCVQYRETDLAFIQRLLAEEGICYFFQHTDGKHTLILSDHNIHHDDHGMGAARYDSSSMSGGTDSVIRRLTHDHLIRPGALELRDHAFRDPNNPLSAYAEHASDTEYEVYDYPGNYVSDELGDLKAGWRLDALQADRDVVRGASDLRWLCPGFCVSIEHAPHDDLDGSYLITRVSHRVIQTTPDDPEWGQDQPAYANTFEAIPSERVFRPPCPSKPRIDGLQTATVTGPAGEEIHVDEFGRIKVKFRWDRRDTTNDESSCWVRVARSWAGANWGQVFHPRVGQEVIVQFLEGDPDRPVVTGMLYNQNSMPPYDLPGHATQSGIKTRSTPSASGANEIRFEDKAGSEELYLHAEKDHTLAVNHDSSTTVGHDKSVSVTQNYSIDVAEGNLTTTVSTGDQTTTVSTGNQSTTISAGNHDMTVAAGTSTTTIHGDTSTTVQSGNWSLGVTAGSASIQAARDITATTTTSASIQALIDASITAGANAAMVAAIAAEVAAMAISVSGGASVSIDAPTIDISGKTVTISGETSITLKVGGTRLVLEEGGVTVITKGDVEFKVDGSQKTKVKGKIQTEAKGKHILKGSKVSVN